MTRLLKLIGGVLRRDWLTYRLQITVITGVLLTSAIMMRSGAVEFARGTAAGGLVAAAFIYGQAGFANERGRGTLKQLLRMAANPFDAVVAKYLSMYSMVLFSANLAGLVYGQWRLLLWADAAVLLLSTLFMASAVISENPGAAHMPIVLLILIAIPLKNATAFLSANATILSVAAAVFSLTLAVVSALIFARDQRA